MSKGPINLSETFKLTKGQVFFSPDEKYVANASQYRLVVRDFETLQIANVYTCIDSIDLVKWSPNGKLILVSCYKRNVSQLWSIVKPGWKCKLDEGSSGLIDSLWCPDSAQILTWSEFDIRINVWSMSDKSVRHIQYPKLQSGGCKFYKNNAIIAERREDTDFVSVFNHKSWRLLCNFKAASVDMAFIEVINGSIFIGDIPLTAVYYAYSFKGECLSRIELYKGILGIKCHSLAQSEQFVALGCYDNSCKLVNAVTWSVLKNMKHDETSLTSETVCYKEVVTQNNSGSRYEIVPPENFILPRAKTSFDDQYLLVGIGIAKFSSSGRFLATRTDFAPSLAWIWDLSLLKLVSVVAHESPIVCMEWEHAVRTQKSEYLAIGCNNDQVYLWNLSGVLALKIPNCSTLNGAGELGPIREISWSDQGNCLILKGDYHFCLSYFPQYDL